MQGGTEPWAVKDLDKKEKGSGHTNLIPFSQYCNLLTQNLNLRK